MAGSFHFHCPDCNIVRSADPGETTTCPACGHSFRLGDGKTVVRPALPEDIAAAEAPARPEDAARVEALRAAIDRASAEPAEPAATGSEEAIGGWAGAAVGIVIAAAGIPLGRWAGEWHEMAGVLVALLLWVWGLATMFAGARQAMGGKAPFAIVATAAGAAIAYFASYAAMDAFGMNAPPPPVENSANAADSTL